MRITTLVPVLLGAVALAGCGGGGRPGTSDVLSRLNAAGVSCEVGQGFAVGTGPAASSSCLTPEGEQIAVYGFDSDEAQKAFLEQSPTLLAGTPFASLVYDFGYVLAVPADALAVRVTTRMDAQRLAVPTARSCPTARDGACPAGAVPTLPTELGAVPTG